ncbi:MAG TPA: ribosome-associated translation inhibitor RaiA [Polyangiaceae bacterium]|jgi:putative sigma-54 modulation protein|nr:ribosome-associated translation inhibitor RaiA [Polyangiaceae bacterium]
MNITITFRHIDGTEAVKRYAHEKIAKLQKFLRQPMTGQLTLTVDGLEHSAEANIQSGPGHFHATERGGDLHACIDMVHDKLERQIRAAKDHDVTRRKGGESVRELIPEDVDTGGADRES